MFSQRLNNYNNFLLGKLKHKMTKQEMMTKVMNENRFNSIHGYCTIIREGQIDHCLEVSRLEDGQLIRLFFDKATARVIRWTILWTLPTFFYSAKESFDILLSAKRIFWYSFIRFGYILQNRSFFRFPLAVKVINFFCN